MNLSTLGAQMSRNVELVDPDQRPGADVVIYDGHCRFCRGQVERLAKFDRSGRLTFISLHDPRVSQRYPDLTHDQLMAQMYLVDTHGHRHAGAAAIRYLSRKLLLLWAAAPLLHLPGSLAIWQWLYQQVARRRYRWGKTADSCDSGSCAIHFGEAKPSSSASAPPLREQKSAR